MSEEGPVSYEITMSTRFEGLKGAEVAAANSFTMSPKSVTSLIKKKLSKLAISDSQDDLRPLKERDLL